MLGDNHELGTFGYLFSGEHQNEVVGLQALGWEIQTSVNYDYYGLERIEKKNCVFQYTISGQGKLEVEGKEYTLQAGEAFLVQVPSNHRYYLPETSEGWEFIFITIYGKEAERVFNLAHEKLGYVLTCHPESSLIQMLMEIYEAAKEQKITDAFQSSAISYSFIMELYRFVLNIDKKEGVYPKPIVKSILFIKNNYEKDIMLDDLVEVSGISKYHFTRLFHKTTNYTPIQYITKVRLNRAIELLKSTDETIDEIAKQVGYANGNYFIKVFQKKIGQSPGQFRAGRYTGMVNRLITD